MTMKVFPMETRKKDNQHIEEYVYSHPEAVFLCRFTSRLSKHDFENHIMEFLSKDQYEVFLLVIHIEGDSKKMYQYVNHLRIIIEQLENEMMNAQKLFVVLLLLPATQLFTSNYPCLYMHGWDLHYLDSISPAVSTSRKSSALKINDWFEQLCISDASITSSHHSIHAFLTDLLEDVIPFVVSRVSFGKHANAVINSPMSCFMRSRLIRSFLMESDVGKVLCTRFQEYWNRETMNKYIKMAAVDIYSHHSILSLADQLQVIFHFLFANFVVYVLNEINTCYGLDMVFTKAGSSGKLTTSLACEPDSEFLLSLLTEMLRYIPVPCISAISIYTNDDESKPLIRRLFDETHCMFPLSHTVLQLFKGILDHSRQTLLQKHKCTSITISESLIIESTKQHWKDALQVYINIIFASDSTTFLFK